MGAYLVASAVAAGIAEGAAGLLAALGSALSLGVRVALGVRADRRRDYGYGVSCCCWPAERRASCCWLAASRPVRDRSAGGLRARLGLAGPVQPRGGAEPPDAPGAATGVSQPGIYVGAGGGPAPSERSPPRPATRPPGLPAPPWRCWRRWCWRGRAPAGCAAAPGVRGPARLNVGPHDPMRVCGARLGITLLQRRGRFSAQWVPPTLPRLVARGLGHGIRARRTFGRLSARRTRGCASRRRRGRPRRSPRWRRASPEPPPPARASARGRAWPRRP